MKTILFTWNPRKWPWDDLPQAVAAANVDGRHVDTWSCGVTRNIHIGDRAFLMRLGQSPKGIMGSGVVVSEPEEGEHWDPDRAAAGDTGYYVEILFDALSPTPILGEDVLSKPPFSAHNWYPMASGTFIPDEIARVLEDVWKKATGTTFIPPAKDDLTRLYIEGTKRTRLVTSCERNPVARKKCVEHYGARCVVCGLSFGETYGNIGNGFIHVHHLKPMAEIDDAYEVDAVRDLRPVCPNCHAMLHKRLPPFSPDEMKEMMKASNNGLLRTGDPRTARQSAEP